MPSPDAQPTQSTQSTQSNQGPPPKEGEEGSGATAPSEGGATLLTGLRFPYRDSENNEVQGLFVVPRAKGLEYESLWMRSSENQPEETDDSRTADRDLKTLQDTIVEEHHQAVEARDRRNIQAIADALSGRGPPVALTTASGEKVAFTRMSRGD